MRIIAGEWRGRHLKAPRDERVRPTGDRVKEALMSIVHPGLVDASVLDLFAGSGALGLEALSRGARSATFVELSGRSLAAVRDNVATLGAGDRATIVKSDAHRYLETVERHAFDIAFADPPYRMGHAAKVASRWLSEPFSATLVLEHEKQLGIEGWSDQRRYGDTVVTFFRST